MNSVCPYNEHIIPRDLGGSDQFVLRADKEENSMFGQGIDSNQICPDIVQLLAARLGPRGRRKPGKPATPTMFKTTGVERDTSQAIKIAFSQNAVAVGFIKPINLDPVTGEIAVFEERLIKSMHCSRTYRSVRLVEGSSSVYYRQLLSRKRRFLRLVL